MLDEAKYIWQDGQLVNWKDAKTHVLTHSLHYGNAAFEGTRAYKTSKGLAIFRLHDHTKRILNSAKILAIKCPYSFDEINNAHIELLRANKECWKENVYIRPLIFLGYGVMGLYHANAPVNMIIAAWNWGAYLGEDGLENGIRIKTSSFVRNSIKSMMQKAKASANYLNSQMAKYEAKQCGFEEALLLDESGFVAEGTGECFFIVRDGELITPPYDNSLESITQNTIFEIARDLGLKVVQRRITRDEVYIADEAFFTGTAAEITPIKELDFRVIGDGKRGKITKQLQDAFFEIVSDNNSKYNKFLTYVD